MIFEITTRDVVIKGETYKLRPLTGRFLPKLYAILAKAPKDQDQEGVMKMFADEQVVQNLYDIAVETLKKSYPEKDITQVEEFVSQNLLALFQPLIELNLGTEQKK
jgi:hypothetical protein